MIARKGLLLIGAAFATLLALVAAVRISRSEPEEPKPPARAASPGSTTPAVPPEPVPPRPSSTADPAPDPRAVNEKTALQEKHARDLARSLRIALEEKNPGPRSGLLRALKSENERGIRALQAEIAAAATPALRADLEAALKELR